MKTVRLSEQLKRDILKNAEDKFNNANPMKEFPQDGYAVLQRLGIMDKTNRSKQVFKEIWGQDMLMREIDNIRLVATPVDADDDGEGNYSYNRTLEFAILAHLPRCLGLWLTMTRLNTKCHQQTKQSLSAWQFVTSMTNVTLRNVNTETNLTL